MMKTLTQKSERLHSLDSLRAIMMMLGIVLHTANTYTGGEPAPGWPLKDPEAGNELLKWLGYTIHNFRMPIFMLVAGFFAALLFYERSPNKMIVNRVKRIVLPFIVFVILLWPLVMLGFSYSQQIFGLAHNYTFSSFFENPSNLIPQRTMHLWFLYYLIMFSVASFGLGKLFQNLPSVIKPIKIVFEKIMRRPLLKLVFFALITFSLLLLIDSYWVATSLSFVPDGGTFSFYFFFYLTGWLLFKSKHLLSSFMQYDRLFTLLGLGIFTLYFLADRTEFSDALTAGIRSVTCWLFIFGFTGLFLRYFSKHSAFMRYISDSAYWVYLLHLPLTAFLPGLMEGWAIPALLKFAIVASATTFICFFTYHYLVRSSFIGEFLNGRKYSRKLNDIKPLEKPVIPNVILVTDDK
ncbi:Acyltransferase family protein [Marivirga sericea]|uniref:Acyltransferase family protein n=1 Tax=Marivirga sericea TaxID=1028 RepID=A0A1X7LGU0_9BACT|nr:acyltransferase family protein [Marivirga sericea]SMG52472.1 Acyltransferase family protein [Marivirga sericea]